MIFRSRLVAILGRRPRRFFALEARNRQQALNDQALRHDRLELVVNEIHARRYAGGELLDRGIGERNSVVERQSLEDAHRLVADVEPAATEEVAALAADQPKRDLAPLSFFDDELPGGLDDVRVEAATQTAVRGDHDQQRPALSGRRDRSNGCAS